MAGGQHHHRTNLDKYHPGYFGKVGMRHFHLQRNHEWKPVVNLDKVSFSDKSIIASTKMSQLWSLLPQETQDKYLAEGAPQDTAPVIDLLALGYAKVLGKGRLPNVPVVVKARYVSKEAERKITEAGGRIILVA